MPKSVHITARPPSYEEQVKRLRIPKARQKRLLAIMDDAWRRHARAAESLEVETNESGTVTIKNAIAAD
jgi:transposase